MIPPFPYLLRLKITLGLFRLAFLLGELGVWVSPELLERRR